MKFAALCAMAALALSMGVGATTASAYSEEMYGYSEPMYGYSEPMYGYSEPMYGYSEPIYGYSEPIYGYSEPMWDYSEPIWDYSEPIWDYSEPIYDYYDYSESLYTYYPSYSYPSYSYPSYNYPSKSYSSSYNYPSYSASKPFTVSAPSSYTSTTNVTNVNQNTNTCTNGSCNTEVTKVDNSINNSFNTTGSYNIEHSFNGNVVADTIEVTALAVAEPQRIVQRMYNSPEPYVALSQITFTGFDLGPVGNAIYWLSLIAVAVAGAYLLVYYRSGMFSLRSAEVAGVPETLTDEPTVSTVSALERLPVREAIVTKDAMSMVRAADGMPRIVINRG